MITKTLNVRQNIWNLQFVSDRKLGLPSPDHDQPTEQPRTLHSTDLTSSSVLEVKWIYVKDPRAQCAPTWLFDISVMARMAGDFQYTG
jgi:hypothetical protein